MNLKTLNILLLFFALATINISIASDSKNVKQDKNEQANQEKIDQLAHGEKAHKNHCYKCHTDQVYTRDNRFVKSINALSKQVTRCKENSNVPWFDEDADAVVQFLNKKYYRF